MGFDVGKPDGLARGKPLARGKQLRSKSRKRQREDRTRSKVLHDHFGDRPPCELGAVWARALLRDDLERHELRALERHTCRRLADDGHEVLTRGRGGSIVDVENVKPACRPCHDLVGHLPALSNRVGLTRPSWSKDQPAE